MENKAGSLKPTLKQSQILLYGFFGMFLNTFYLMFLAYNRLFYLTNVLQLSTTVSAIVNSLSVWGNVVTMILAGVFVDKISFKLGKFRTWTLVGGIVMAIVFPFMFSDLGLSQAAAGALFVVLFVIQSIGYNCLWVAERSLVGPLSGNSADANSLAMMAQQGSTLGGLIYGVVSTPILNLFGGSYTLTALLYGLFILGGTFGMFCMTKKYDLPVEKVGEAEKQAGAAQKKNGGMLKALTGPTVPFFFAMILNNCHLGFFMTLLAYFTTYVLNDPVILGISVTAGSAAGLVGAWLSKVICNKIGKKKAFIYFSILTGILYMLIAYIGKTSIPFLIIRVCIGAFSVVGGMLIPVFANDIADYKEMKGETDARALVQSIAGTTIRFGTALSTTIASFGLAAVGFSAQAEVTPAIIGSITNLMAFGPAAVCVLSALIFIFYKIDEKEVDEYRAQKAAKIAAAAKADK